MAGYVLKIVLEDTHPPVWRRLLVPEGITFGELHEMIQIAFGWEEEHLHEFYVPRADIRIGCDDGLAEDETLLEDFLFCGKWIRYTYDFGDYWRHKIFYEKTEENYEKRYAELLKFKGDNFEEDSGGVWSGNEGRSTFSPEETGKRLKTLLCPEHEELKARLDLFDAELEDGMRKAVEALMNSLSSHNGISGNGKQAAKRTSEMARRIAAWRAFLDEEEGADGAYPVEIVPAGGRVASADGMAASVDRGNVTAGRTNRELLQALGMQEAKDYCKYLQIPVNAVWGKEELIGKITQAFEEHPEYLLYVFFEDEYKEIRKWIKAPGCLRGTRPELEIVATKALCLGLVEIEFPTKEGKRTAQISFAGDIRTFTDRLDRKLCRQTYRFLDAMSEQLEGIILVYGAVELRSLYEMMRIVRGKTIEKEDFYRFVYWHARFNNLIQTAYMDDGSCYALSVQIDALAVIPAMKKYTEDMEYARISPEEISFLASDISKSSEYMPILMDILCSFPKLSEEAAIGIVEDVFIDIMNGKTLPEVLEYIFSAIPEAQDTLENRCDIWNCAAGIMLDLRLPMLKGRTRTEYAEEIGGTPWQVGMLGEEKSKGGNGRRKEAVHGAEAAPAYKEQDARMCGFPAEIQELMYQAYNFAGREAMAKLLKYKEEQDICSEEFLYLLAAAHAMGCEFGIAQNLMEKLKKSSVCGRKASKHLKRMIEEGMGVTEDNADDAFGAEDKRNLFAWEDWLQEQYQKAQPYVREERKIGRNEPCPCGSGKKYKQCCGRGKKQ